MAIQEGETTSKLTTCANRKLTVIPSSDLQLPIRNIIRKITHDITFRNTLSRVSTHKTLPVRESYEGVFVLNLWLPLMSIRKSAQLRLIPSTSPENVLT